MTMLPKSITITDHKMWIDGAECPWYLAEQGPTLEVDGPLMILTLPIIVFTDECIVTDLRSTEPREAAK